MAWLTTLVTPPAKTPTQPAPTWIDRQINALTSTLGRFLGNPLVEGLGNEIPQSYSPFRQAEGVYVFDLVPDGQGGITALPFDPARTVGLALGVFGDSQASGVEPLIGVNADHVDHGLANTLPYHLGSQFTGDHGPVRVLVAAKPGARTRDVIGYTRRNGTPVAGQAELTSSWGKASGVKLDLATLIVGAQDIKAVLSGRLSIAALVGQLDQALTDLHEQAGAVVTGTCSNFASIRTVASDPLRRPVFSGVSYVMAALQSGVVVHAMANQLNVVAFHMRAFGGDYLPCFFVDNAHLGHEGNLRLAPEIHKCGLKALARKGQDPVAATARQALTRRGIRHTVAAQQRGLTMVAGNAAMLFTTMSGLPLVGKPTVWDPSKATPNRGLKARRVAALLHRGATSRLPRQLRPTRGRSLVTKPALRGQLVGSETHRRSA